MLFHQCSKKLPPPGSFSILADCGETTSVSMEIVEANLLFNPIPSFKSVKTMGKVDPGHLQRTVDKQSERARHVFL